jgi:hypothetical protein
MSRLVTLILSLALTAAGPAAPPKQTNGVISFPQLPSVGIFPNQPAIKIQQGQTKTLTLTGAVYGFIPFNGDINFFPNGPKATACPIFLSGTNPNVTFPPNSESVAVKLVVMAPANTPRGSYNCALTYAALQNTPNGPAYVGGGIQINVPYNVIAPK